MNPQENPEQSQATPEDNTQKTPDLNSPQELSGVSPQAQPATTPQQVSATPESQPFGQPVVGNVIDPALLPPPPNDSKAPKKKRIIIAAAGLFLLLLSVGVGFYFLYWMNPSVVYRQALSNTGKGLGALLEETQKPENATLYDKYQFTADLSSAESDMNVKGSIDVKASEGNSLGKLNIEAKGAKLSADLVSLKANSQYPDYYFKVSGIKSLFDTLGGSDSEYATKLIALDSSWISINHEYWEKLQKDAAIASGSNGDSKKQTTPSRGQVLDAMQAVNKTNQEYLFTVDDSKAVLEERTYHGQENIDGYSTQHYTMGFNKNNTKSYINALQKAISTSKLNDWIKENDYQEGFDKTMKNMADSTKDIKQNDTFDMWIDRGNRIVYKVRFSDGKNKKSYMDVGLRYKGGDELPFFIAAKWGDGGELTMNINVNQKNQTIMSDFKAGGSGYSYSGNLKLQPISQSVKVNRPAQSKSIEEVMKSLGFNDTVGAQAVSSDGSVAE